MELNVQPVIKYILIILITYIYLILLTKKLIGDHKEIHAQKRCV